MTAAQLMLGPRDSYFYLIADNADVKFEVQGMQFPV